MDDTIPTMHIDGAARGNPGPASYAVVINRPGLPPIEEADTIGKTTNNVAEYTALVKGLERAQELGLKRLRVFSDSELLVKQMNGEYRVKHPDLIPLHTEARQLVKQFTDIHINHVRRADNARADQIGNDALDGKPRRKGEDFIAPVDAAKPATGAGPKPKVVDNRPPSDLPVREEALACLTAAAKVWSEQGLASWPVGMVWEQLWGILDEGGVLKKRQGR